ncbi:MAG: FMN-binding negative transcriptional regulator [bacterium]
MYIPQYYRITDPKIVADFLQQNNFAVLISCENGMPVATHLPLEFVHAENEQFLHGHVARANPQWRSFNSSEMVLAVFSGAHSYVSARWYNHLNVPTWNYMAVHVYGRPRIIEDSDELYAMLKRLVDKHEAATNPQNPYTMEGLPEEFLKKEMKGLVGFQIKVEKIEAKFKLSQNRKAEDFANVIAELRKSQHAEAQEVAEAMVQIQSKDSLTSSDHPQTRSN